MLHYDIINPLVSKFLAKISGQGGTYYSADAISKVNDLADYLCSIQDDLEFAYFPLRKHNNIGYGNEAFGIGNLSSGTSLKFPNQVNWHESGIFLNSTKNCGELDFSGTTSDPHFQFRKNPTTVFYFLKHARGKYETSLYRPGTEQPPYFCFDKSVDTFAVVAPCFSTDQFSPRGTTYIYDEIFGGDKKGFTIDYSADQIKKVIERDPGSFYEVDSGTEEFVCLMLYSEFDSYEIRSFYSKDPGIYTGSFPAPYRITVVPGTIEDPEYWMPTRMVIGAGMSNEGRQTYDTDGLDHYCAGFLIFNGDQRKNAFNIVANMAESLAIILPSLPVSGNANDNVFTSSNINNLLYVSAEPKTVNTADVIFRTITPNIVGFFLRDIGNWSISLVGNRWEAFSPTEYFEIGNQNRVSGLDYISGIVDYKLLPIENIYNQGVYGKISGIMNPDGTFTPFAPNLKASFSGFYSGVFTNYSGISSGSGYFIGPYSRGYTGQRLTLLEQNVIQFPPYRTSGTEKIVGYISGEITNNFNFSRFTNDLQKSGYFINETRVDFPYTGLIDEVITGYISGTLKEDGLFLPSTGIYQNSGFIKNNLFYKFLPDQILEPILITGFLFGTMFGDGTFIGKDQDPIITGEYSGYYVNNYEDIYFDTGINASVNFEKTPGFVDPELGYEFSGFFVEQSGFIGFTDPFVGDGLMTGHIGYKNILKYSGAFTGISGFSELDYGYGNTYYGLDANSFTGFSGAQLDQFTEEILPTGKGILTGIIGFVRKPLRVDFEGFSNDPNFDPGFSNTVYGFDFSNSGFISNNILPRKRIVGFISGLLNQSLQFVNYASTGDGLSGSSGYFIDDRQYFFPQNQVDHTDFYSKNSIFEYPNLVYSGYSFAEGSGFSGTVSNIFGNGIMTGYIGHLQINSGTGILTGYLGERNLLIQSGNYSGLRGFGFTDPYLRAVGTTFSFYESTGFSGIGGQNTGVGFLSGLITTGLGQFPIADIIYPIGNFSFGTGTGISTGILYISGVVPTNISGIFESVEFLSGMFSGNITGFEYVSSTREFSLTGISGDFMTGGPRMISGNISGITYITGVILSPDLTGTQGDILGTGMSASVTDIFFVASDIPSILFESTTGIMSGNITTILYYEDVTGIDVAIESGRFSGTIDNLIYETDILDHITGIETGIYTASGFGRIGAYIYPSILETGDYSISSLELTSTRWNPPASGLIFRFDADAGITTGISGRVMNWQDSFSGINAIPIINNSGRIYKTGTNWIVEGDWVDRDITRSNFIAISGGIYPQGVTVTSPTTTLDNGIQVRYRFSPDTFNVFFFRDAFSSFFNSFSPSHGGGKIYEPIASDDPIRPHNTIFSRERLDSGLMVNAPIEYYNSRISGEYFNRNSVIFNGDSYFKFSIPTGVINNQDRSYVIIGKYNDPLNRPNETMLSSNGVFGNIEHSGYSYKNRYWNQYTGSNPTIELENPAIATYFVQTIIHSQNQQIMRINNSSGSFTGSQSVNKNHQSKFIIGGISGSYQSSSNVMSGCIVEILGYNRALNDQEIEQIEAYADI